MCDHRLVILNRLPDTAPGQPKRLQTPSKWSLIIIFLNRNSFAKFSSMATAPNIGVDFLLLFSVFESMKEKLRFWEVTKHGCLKPHETMILGAWKRPNTPCWPILHHSMALSNTYNSQHEGQWQLLLILFHSVADNIFVTKALA